MRNGRFCGEEARTPENLQRWFDTFPGRLLLSAEKAELEQLGRELFGYYFLQVGCLGFRGEPLCSSRARNHILLSPEAPDRPGSGQVRGAPFSLPVKSEFIDNLLLPHTLDFSRDPRQVLREAERVLIPEGRVIVLGFNPWGFWGLWRQLRIGRRGLPWCGHFLSMRRLNDWLSLLGFVVEQSRQIMFRPPLQNRSLMNSLQPLEAYGARFWPALSAAYAVVAVKRVSAVAPVGPAWRLPARVIRGHAIEPSARSGQGG